MDDLQLELNNMLLELKKSFSGKTATLKDNIVANAYRQGEIDHIGSSIYIFELQSKGVIFETSMINFINNFEEIKERIDLLQ